MKGNYFEISPQDISEGIAKTAQKDSIMSTIGFSTRKMALIIFLLLLFSLPLPSAGEALYDFRIEKESLIMKDGVGIALTFYRPVEKYRGERFPVVFEMLPYRKDDIFAMRDYSLYSYFVQRGIVMAKADVRGTGSSDGMIPEKEYSEEEMSDALEIIDYLSRRPWSNGNVGMWGISWGGFNAIQVAMRKPPALKAILAADASDDLYHDDVHYIDGIFHVDEYELSIENDLILPRYPYYPIDESYFRDRFERYPWFLTYKKHQSDGAFWRENSLRWRYDLLTIPSYLIGGLADGYRDSIPRMLENVTAPVTAQMGPWNHAWPDDGIPGPVHEWRGEITDWWMQHLAGKKGFSRNYPPFEIFLREGDLPDAGLITASGRWVREQWPVAGTRWETLYLNGSHSLGRKAAGQATHELEYRPGAGVMGRYWWGEATGDMSGDDGAALVYDGEALRHDVGIIGIPRVRLRVSSSAPLAHWIVRLEDVFPDGRVALVTGAAQNGAQISSREEPRQLEPGKIYDITLDLHFTTWTFKPGHRIRVAVSNAQFPMLWPTPWPMSTRLFSGIAESRIELPVVSGLKDLTPPHDPPEPREEMPFSRDLPAEWPQYDRVTRENGIVSVEFRGERAFEHEGNTYSAFEKTLYVTNERDPAHSSFHGEAGNDVRLLMGRREISVRTFIDVVSDELNFAIDFRRQISENGKLLREKTWKETIPRAFQ